MYVPFACIEYNQESNHKSYTNPTSEYELDSKIIIRTCLFKIMASLTFDKAVSRILSPVVDMATEREKKTQRFINMINQ